MSSNDNSGSAPSRARQPLSELRAILQEARSADDAERIHVALIDVVDGLITHAENQARAVEDMHSDMAHKQGIVTKIGGGDFQAGPLREFATTSNGDRWLLGRDERTGAGYVEHRANQPSGGAIARIEIGAFLAKGANSPEHQALVRLIGGLAEEA